MLERALAMGVVVCLLLGAGLLLKADDALPQEAQAAPETEQGASPAAPPREETPREPPAPAAPAANPTLLGGLLKGVLGADHEEKDKEETPDKVPGKGGKGKGKGK